MARVNIPKNPDELIKLAQSINTKHTSDGADSPLSGLNMTEFNTKTGNADLSNKTAAQLHRQAEQATENRDIALGADAAPAGSVMQYVRSVRDVLLGIYKGNERKLGDWGFQVDSSAQSSSKPTPPSA